jgi:hypothetical protein
MKLVLVGLVAQEHLDKVVLAVQQLMVLHLDGLQAVAAVLVVQVVQHIDPMG